MMWRAFVVVMLVACAAKPSLTAEDRKALDDFRAAERVAVRDGAITWEQFTHGTTDHWDASRRVSAASKAWHAAGARLPKQLADRELDTILQAYLAARTEAWSSMNRSFGFDDDYAAHALAYPKLDEAATAASAALDAALAKRDLAALPPLTPDAGIVFAPPPAAPPGAAYFLAGSTALVLDDAGFHVVATDIESIHVAANGIMWACATWVAVKWDGKQATTIKPKYYNQTCGIGPDGTLWTLNGGDTPKDEQLAAFDGKTWRLVKGALENGWRGAEQLLATGDGTLYAVHDKHLKVLRKTGWEEVPRAEDTSIEHIFRARDGSPWIIHQVTASTTESRYPDALSRIEPTGVAKPVWVDGHFQTSNLWADVDTAGTPTIFDARGNLIIRGTQTLRLPVPNTHRYWDNQPDGFAYDAAGRIWVDLVDGLSVIDPDGTRHVFPIGSVDGIRRPVRRIVVLGAGPKLPPPGTAATRTIQGTIKSAPHSDVEMCVAGECAKGVKTWKATTDSEGRFTFEGVPRYRFELRAHVGSRGKKHWKSLTTDCCDGDQTVIDFNLAPDPLY